MNNKAEVTAQNRMQDMDLKHRPNSAGNRINVCCHIDSTRFGFSKTVKARVRFTL
jgi:hypothetical protein